MSLRVVRQQCLSRTAAEVLNEMNKVVAFIAMVAMVKEGKIDFVDTGLKVRDLVRRCIR